MENLRIVEEKALLKEMGLKPTSKLVVEQGEVIGVKTSSGSFDYSEEHKAFAESGTIRLSNLAPLVPIIFS